MICQKMLLNSGNKIIISPSGRKFMRHSSNLGTIMNFTVDGVDYQDVFIFDAVYRGSGVIITNTTKDSSLTNFQTTNTSGNWDIDGDGDFDAATNHPVLSDEELSALWVNSIDDRTSNYNTETWMTYPDSTAPKLCDERKIGDKNPLRGRMPNIQILMRIFCDANVIDSLDPTVAENPHLALGDANTNGFWKVDGMSAVFSSTEYNNANCRGIKATGECSYLSKSSTFAVIPIIEL